MTASREDNSMEDLVLELPSLYGDHHVLKVRDVLIALEGVGEVYASSAWRHVMVSFDPKKIKASEIEAALSQAGYPPGPGAIPELVIASSKIKRDPQWELLGSRVTETNEADIRMSGEFRRY
jgi:Heavy-metal-associated domain